MLHPKKINFNLFVVIVTLICYILNFQPESGVFITESFFIDLLNILPPDNCFKKNNISPTLFLSANFLKTLEKSGFLLHCVTKITV